MLQDTRIRIAAVVGAVAIVVGAIAVFVLGGDDGDVETVASTTTTTEATTTTTEAPAPTSALTGLPMADDLRARPVVAVKFDNVDGKSTPQVGINEADVVYEIQVEGQVTRLLALFQSADAAPIGPVRSARGSEVGLLEELNRPLFTWHGANEILRPLVVNSSVIPRSIDDIPQLFYRESSRSAPYNSFVQGTAQIRATAPADAAGPTVPILTFGAPGEAPSALAQPATTVTIRFPPPFGRGGGEAPVTYKWDDTVDVWRRDQAGHNHVDGAGMQVAVQNVIVRFTEAIDSGTVDKAGTRVPTAKVVGEGEAWIFTGGTVTVGKWVKADNLSPTQYLDAEGNPVKLTPGKTWISMPYGNAGSSFG